MKHMGLYKVYLIVHQVVRNLVFTMHDMHSSYNIHHNLPLMQAVHFGTHCYSMMKDINYAQIPPLISHIILKRVEVHFLSMND
jgi:hypothetical protein